MNTHERVKRILLGGVTDALVLCVLFSLVLQVIPTWGATPAEAARQFPGNELISNPTVNWTHAITINAPPARVWGWIAQLGERRGAFYSYTFIENQMGNGDVYHNADRIVPEWQNPKPGDVLISGALPMRVYQVQPEKRMVAFMHGAFDWMWGWFLEPLDQNRTRLIVRMRIQMPAGSSNPLIDSGIALGGFVMEQGMLQGIQTRAEDDIPPSYSEPLAIAVWLFTFAVAVIAAMLFVTFKNWAVPFAIGLFAILALFLFTFWQPPMLMRIVTAFVLSSGLVWTALNEYKANASHAVSGDQPDSLTLKPTVAN